MRRRLLIPVLCIAAAVSLGACKKKRRAAPPVEGAAPETLEPLAEPMAGGGAGASPAAAAEQLTAQVAAARAEDEKLRADPKVKAEIETFCNGVYTEIEKARTAEGKKTMPPKDALMATCTSLPPYALRCIEPEFASKNQQACEAYVGSLPKPEVDAIGRMFAWMEGKDAEVPAAAGAESGAKGDEAAGKARAGGKAAGAAKAGAKGKAAPK